MNNVCRYWLPWTACRVVVLIVTLVILFATIGCEIGDGGTNGTEDDTTAPPAPTLSYTSTARGFTVSWDAVTDPSGIEGYIVNLDGTDQTLQTGTSFTQSDLVRGEYTVKVKAKDREGNESAYSSSAEIPIVVEDLTDSVFGENILMVINVSGDTDGFGEAIGTVPTPISRISDRSRRTDSKEVRPMIRDREALVGVSRTMHVPRTISPGLTEDDTTYTFIGHYGIDSIDYVDIDATLRYGDETSTCLIYVENGLETGSNEYGESWDLSTWNSVGADFDNNIYQPVTDVFGNPTDVDSNEKIVILYYEIYDTDGTTPDDSTQGYFYYPDLYEYTETEPSNEMEIFYINLNWGGPDNSSMMETLAHEFQHMINYGQRVIINDLPAMDTWINEGLAELSADIGLDQYLTGRIDTFVDDLNYTLEEGYPLCVWYGEDEDYALSYTFLSYLYIQTDYDNTLCPDLIASEYGDYRCVEEAITSRMSEFGDFSDILIGYRAANLLNQPTGIYGYYGVTEFADLAGNHRPTSVDGIDLEPGGCLYISTDTTTLDDFSPSDQEDNIVYVRVY